MTRVKICGLARRDDAELAIELGADALGFVFEPTSPRFVGESFDWIYRLPPLPLRVAVFGRYYPIRCQVDTIQSVDWPTAPIHRRFQVLRLKVGQSAEEAISEFMVDCDGQMVREGMQGMDSECPGNIDPAARTPSALVLDAYREDAYGGTGHTVDWAVAAEIVRLSTVPVILAGGLGPHTVAEAISRVRPFAVDVSSGIEASPGIKDPVKMRDFIQAAKQATGYDENGV